MFTCSSTFLSGNLAHAYPIYMFPDTEISNFHNVSKSRETWDFLKCQEITHKTDFMHIPLYLIFLKYVQKPPENVDFSKTFVDRK